MEEGGRKMGGGGAAPRPRLTRSASFACSRHTQGRRQGNEKLGLGEAQFVFIYYRGVFVGCSGPWAGLRIQNGPKYLGRYTLIPGQNEMDEIR